MTECPQTQFQTAKETRHLHTGKSTLKNRQAPILTLPKTGLFNTRHPLGLSELQIVVISYQHVQGQKNQSQRYYEIWTGGKCKLANLMLCLVRDQHQTEISCKIPSFSLKTNVVESHSRHSFLQHEKTHLVGTVGILRGWDDL